MARKHLNSQPIRNDTFFTVSISSLYTNTISLFHRADYTRVLPPHSYIDAGKHSPAELARLLHRLDQDQEEYLSYFWWMDHYSPTIYMNSVMPICQLCRKLVAGDPEEGRMSSSVDLEKWWWEGSQCREYQHWWPPSTD